MQYKDVKAKCLFCEATVESNQRSMAGMWRDELTSQWLEEKSGPRWLYFGWGNPDTPHFQDFYLCPQHNDPSHFDIAEKWSDEQLKKGEIVDFADPAAMTLSTSEVYRLGKEPPLSHYVPQLNEIEALSKLPNIWQIGDPRLKGCLEISWALTDIFDGSRSPLLLDYLELPSLPTPLELAEAMKKMARNIELVTISGKPAD